MLHWLAPALQPILAELIGAQDSTVPDHEPKAKLSVKALEISTCVSSHGYHKHQ